MKSPFYYFGPCVLRSILMYSGILGTVNSNPIHNTSNMLSKLSSLHYEMIAFNCLNSCLMCKPNMEKSKS